MWFYLCIYVNVEIIDIERIYRPSVLHMDYAQLITFLGLTQDYKAALTA